MPSFAKVDPEQVLRDVHMGPPPTIPAYDAKWTPLNAMYLMLIHCGIRHTEFLLERAIVHRKKLDSRQLVPSASSLLRLVLQIIAKKEYFSDFQVDLVSMVCASRSDHNFRRESNQADVFKQLAFYAVPSAGVLAIELLRGQHPQAQPDSLHQRPQLIQQLSVLVWALDSVTPSNANYETCAQGKVALQRVLDHILEAQTSPLQMNIEAGTGVQPFEDFGDFAMVTNDADLLQWLSGEWLDRL